METIQIGDFSKLKKLGSLTLSPSGRKAAFCVIQPDLADNCYRCDVWAYDETHSPALFRLTQAVPGCAPVFFDEDTLLLSGDLHGRYPSTGLTKNTLFRRVSLESGQESDAFVLPFAASHLTPLSETRYLARGLRDLSAPDLSGLDEDARAAALKDWEERKTYDTFDELPFWADGSGIVNKTRHGLYLVDTQANTQTLLSPHHMTVHGLRVNASRTKVFYWGVDFVSVSWAKTRAFLYDLADGSQIELPFHEEYLMDNAAFAGDQIIFAATTGDRYGYPQNRDFYLCQPDGSFSLIASPDCSFGTVGSDIAGGGAAATGGDGLHFLHVLGHHGAYARVSPDGVLKTLVGPEDISTVSCAVGHENCVFFVGMEIDGAQELYRKRNGSVELLSSFNTPYFTSHTVAHTEHFTFTDPDGFEIDSWILRPADFDSTKRYPAILSIHGGPKSAYSGHFYHQYQYWASRGYIVFYCNPRGSTGKGDEFADIYGDRFGVTDYNCLMQFVDEVLLRIPQIDPARVGVTGISYGGFMTNWIIGHTDRFAAAVSQCSISNYTSKCLTTDIGYYWNLSALQCDPWSSPDKLWAHSPLAYANRVKTPTLFIHADKDYRCWMGDAVQMLQALLMHGVPAKMCLFHGESHIFHEIGKPKNRLNRLKEITAWFDHYLSPDQSIL